jgi:magnesium-protoporphyrin IX monomethyl ester (oxidative) cyclase
MFSPPHRICFDDISRVPIYSDSQAAAAYARKHGEIANMAMIIKLVNMPFANLNTPSIALTQLKSIVSRRFGGSVNSEIQYLNHDFANVMGVPAYEFVANSLPGHVAGLGEWLFRRIVFPELPDNRDEYAERYTHHLQSLPDMELPTLLGPFRERLPEILDGLIERYGLADADILGVTSMFFQTLPCLALMRRLRLRNSRMIFVMGGANCESTMGIELACNIQGLDFVFSGHALVSFPQFVGHVLDADMEACHRIDGVFSRRNSRSISGTAGSADLSRVNWGTLRARDQLFGIAEIGRELDIDCEVQLDYNDFLRSYHEKISPGEDKPKPMLLFETSRGCWWGERAHCTFCGLNGGTMAYRAMKPSLALRTIELLISSYGNAVDSLQCVDNIMPKEYVNEVFAKLSVPDNIKIFYEVKSDLSAAQLRILSRGGVRQVQPGVEALATATLKLMRKGTTAFRNLRFLADCDAEGVEPTWNLLIGFPGETAETYESYAKLLPMLFHLPPPSGVFPVRFDRFSPYFTQQREYGLDLAPYDFYALCYPFAPLVLMNMAYYFQDLNYTARYFGDTALWLAPLQEMVRRWRELWSSSNRRPSLLFRPRGAGGQVNDTRTGQALTVILSAQGAQLLKELREPALVEQLSPERRAVLPELLDAHLLFAERGRVMSLVSHLSPPEDDEAVIPHSSGLTGANRAGATAQPG